jgi:hypothetical protein
MAVTMENIYAINGKLRAAYNHQFNFYLMCNVFFLNSIQFPISPSPEASP